MEHVIQHLRAEQAKRELSNTEFAELLGCSRPYLQAIYAGDRVPTVRWARRSLIILGFVVDLKISKKRN